MEEVWCTAEGSHVPHEFYPYTGKGIAHCPGYPVKAVKLKRDAINHPEHYNNHPSGIECIEIIEHMSFNLGSVIKYVWRADHKGNDLEDLKKAEWYIQREIQKRMLKVEGI